MHNTRCNDYEKGRKAAAANQATLTQIPKTEQCSTFANYNDDNRKAKYYF